MQRIFLSIFVFITFVFSTLLLTFLMANLPCIGDGSDYGSVLLTDFESDILGELSPTLQTIVFLLQKEPKI